MVDKQNYVFKKFIDILPLPSPGKNDMKNFAFRRK